MNGTPHRPRRTPTAISRRTLLTDLGRASLAAVVLGPVVAACTDGDGGGSVATDDAGAASDDADAAGPDGTPAASPPSASSSGSATGLRWARAPYEIVSAYVLVRDGAAVVFDTGERSGGTAPITDALTALGIGWDAVGDVIISHRHDDHVGGLTAVLGEAPGASVHAAMPDLEVVRRQAQAAVEVRDGDEVLGLRVVATPGHTLGHIAAYDEDAGLLLAGDAVVNGVAIGGASGVGIEVSPRSFTADPDLAGTSVGVLADLGPSTILFGHGDPVTADAAEQLETAVPTA